MPKTTTRAEQETVVRWDEDEKVVHVWSASPVIWRKAGPAGDRAAPGGTAGRRGHRPAVRGAARPVPLGPQIGPAWATPSPGWALVG